MVTCPACGKENEDSALDCKRCRAPLRDEAPPEEVTAAEAAPAEAGASSESLGEVCRRCETYNEPGVRVCTNCGYQLFADALAKAAPAEEPPAEEPAMDKTPPQASVPPHDAPPPDGMADELSALAIADEEAAEAGMSTAG